MNPQRDWTDGEPAILLHQCSVCGKRFYLPRLRCPRCFAAEVQTRPARTTGIAAAVTVVPSPGGNDLDRGICVVDLDDGIRVLTRCAPDIEPGDRVTTTFSSDSWNGEAEWSGPLVPESRKAPA